MIVGHYWWQPECFSKMLAHVFYIGGQLLLLCGCGWIKRPVCCFGSKLLHVHVLTEQRAGGGIHQRCPPPTALYSPFQPPAMERSWRQQLKYCPMLLPLPYRKFVVVDMFNVHHHNLFVSWACCKRYVKRDFGSKDYVLLSSRAIYVLLSSRETFWHTSVQFVWTTIFSVVWLKGLTVCLIRWPSN